MTTWIHVNLNRIRSRVLGNTNDPVIRFQQGKYGKPTYGDVVGIFDADGNEVARFCSSFDKPLLPCGAKVAVQTNLEVRVINEE